MGIGVLLAATAATLALVLALPVTVPLRASLLLYVFATSARACRALLAPRGLRLRRSGEIQVREGERWTEGTVRDGSFVMPWLTLVRWRPEAARRDRALLLLPGMAPREHLRQIRVFLRWG